MKESENTQEHGPIKRNEEVIELFTELLRAFEEQKAEEMAAYGAIDHDDDSGISWPRWCCNNSYHSNWEQIGTKRFEALCHTVEELLAPMSMVKTELHPQIGYFKIEYDQEGRPVDWRASFIVEQTVFAHGNRGILFDVDCADIVDCVGDWLYGRDASDPSWAESALFRLAVAIRACISLVNAGKPCAICVRATVVNNGSRDWSVAPPTRANEASAVVLVTGDEDGIIAPVCDISTGQIAIYWDGPVGLVSPEGSMDSVRTILDALASSRLVRSIGNEKFSLNCIGGTSENGFVYDHLSLRISCDALSDWSVTSEEIAADLEDRVRPMSEHWKVHIGERRGIQVEDETTMFEAEAYGRAAASAAMMPHKRGSLTRMASIYASRNPRTIAFSIGGHAVTNLVLRSADLAAKLVRVAEAAEQAGGSDL